MLVVRSPSSIGATRLLRLYRTVLRPTSTSSPSSSGVESTEEDTLRTRTTPTSRTRLVKDDGLGLSYFIHASSSSSSSSLSLRDSSSSEVTLPAMAAELGDEFDDNDDEGLDFMVTDAMSSSNKNRTINASDRLGQQMIGTDDDVDDNISIRNNNTTTTLKFHLKTYGCQMNVNDTFIVRSILLNHHHAPPPTTVNTVNGESALSLPLRFIETTNEIDADILLTNTCAIRENAEQKVWHRLRELRSHDRNFPLLPHTAVDGYDGEDDGTSPLRQPHRQQSRKKRKRIVGVLGCMAERLKEDMFQDGTADVVVGPDAYRDLPRLLSMLAGQRHYHQTRVPTERAVNVRLSLDETYADVAPIRSDPEDVSAFVSIMRGCNNMCSYCVVPFTRGRERSREMDSVVDETRRLLDNEGIREVILLGQNVNSYYDARRRGTGSRNDDDKDTADGSSSSTYRTSNDGFSNVFRLRHGDGHRFADLLEAVSYLSPELRVRFTSPHPKDYPPELLRLMSERANICNHLHMPAQSGSSTVLERMRRGYTREAYLELIEDVRCLIPDVAISSDFISGFCAETEVEHNETLSLMDAVQFDQAFMFAYSMRGKTHAHRTMVDDVPPDVKQRRLNEVIDNFRRNVQRRNEQVELGRLRLVLIEGEAKRSTVENRMLSGRTDQNKRVVFASEACWTEEEFLRLLSSTSLVRGGAILDSLLLDDLASKLQTKVELSRGDYAIVQITHVRGHTLKGRGLMRSSIAGFERLMNMQETVEDTSSSLDRIMTL